jgi:multicomponent Na+:H+ antiporter subunit F
MANLNPWLAAVIALLPPLAVAFSIGLRGRSADRLIALELAASMTVLILVLMSFAFAQPSFVDLALTLTLLALPGTLVFARFLERWL